MNHSQGGGYKPHNTHAPSGAPGPHGGDRMGYNRGGSQGPSGRGGHYPSQPAYGRGAPSYSQGRPPGPAYPTHGAPPPAHYDNRPPPNYQSRERSQGYTPHHNSRGRGHYDQPPMDKGPYMHHNRGPPMDSGRGGYSQPPAGYNRGGYTPPPMNRQFQDRRQPREMRPRRDTKWKDPIMKQEISTFFSQYASFILSAKAYHNELNVNTDNLQQEEKKEVPQTTVPAIVPPQVTPQANPEPSATQTSSDKDKPVVASTPNLANAQSSPAVDQSNL